MIACLYDVHGNLPALEAVLDDANLQGVTGYLLGGDYAVFGAWPAETVERLRTLEEATWVRGNGDRWVAEPASAPEHARAAVDSCRSVLDAETAEWLGALPHDAQVGDTLAVHASPISDMRSFLPEASDEDEEMLAGAAPSRLLFGHTHIAFRRQFGDVELVNPGSVGMPFDGDPRAAYALLHADGTLEHRRVAYDHDASAGELEQRFAGEPWVPAMAARLRQARFDAS